MASITIMHGHKNLLFASCVANETGAEFEEDGQWITISDEPELTIPHYCYSQTFDPEGRRSAQGDPRLDSGWRSLILNKRGYLVRFDEFEILISDVKPQEERKRPSFLLRFPSEDDKARAEVWAERLHLTMTDFILAAIDRYEQTLQERSVDSPPAGQ